MIRTPATKARRGRALSATALRQDLYRVLDRVVATGEPAIVERKGVVLEIVVAARAPDLGRLPSRPDLIVGDPDELIHLDWSAEWKP